MAKKSCHHHQAILIQGHGGKSQAYLELPQLLKVSDSPTEDSNTFHLLTRATAKRSFSSISESIMKAEPPCARLARPETKWTDRFFWWSPSTTTGSTMEQQLISRPAPCARGTCPVDPNDVEKGPAVLPLQLSTQLSKAAPQAGNRAELDAAIARFLQPGAEKELNISHPLRQRTLAKLQVSSDPQHLKPVADHIYEVMKNCSHRNFVALGVATGSYETICVGNLIGIACVLGGFLLVLLRALYPHIGAHSRWEVFDSWPLWWLGTTVPLLVSKRDSELKLIVPLLTYDRVRKGCVRSCCPCRRGRLYRGRSLRRITVLRHRHKGRS